MVLTLLPTTALAADDELVLMFTDGRTPEKGEDKDYTYENGTLEIRKSGNYTVSMRQNGATTDNRISVKPDPIGPVNLTLDNVKIERKGTKDNWVDGPLIWSDTSNFDLTLTLTGDNSLTLDNVDDTPSGDEQFSYVMSVGTSTDNKTTIQGNGSLTINAKGTSGGGIMSQNWLLIKSGNITIKSNSNGIHTVTSDLTRYEQTGGRVIIETGSNECVGLQSESFLLSGGSLSLNGDNGYGLKADYGITVSGGNLKINGYQYGGIIASGYDDTAKGTGLISFTGGVTDVVAPDGSPAIFSAYTMNNNDTDHSYPAQRITLSPNMRVTAGGRPVWTDWMEYSDTSVTVSAFSTSQPTFGGKTGIENTSSHVHIEPISPNVPNTGDSAQPALWLGIALMACAGLAASLVIRRRRQNG